MDDVMPHHGYGCTTFLLGKLSNDVMPQHRRHIIEASLATPTLGAGFLNFLKPLNFDWIFKAAFSTSGSVKSMSTSSSGGGGFCAGAAGSGGGADACAGAVGREGAAGAGSSWVTQAKVKGQGKIAVPATKEKSSVCGNGSKISVKTC